MEVLKIETGFNKQIAVGKIKLNTKNVDIKLMRTQHFWNYLHHVRSKSKD